MTIQIRDATEKDMPAVARLAGATFHPTTDWITRQVFPLHLQPKNIPDGDSSLPWRQLRKTASFNTSNCTIILAVDTALNDQIVGFAVWERPIDDEKPPTAPADPELPSDVTDMKVFEELKSILKEDHQASFGDRELKDVWHLDMIGVDPLHQRRGIGKTLLTWGMRQATKAGRDCYLMATPQGRPLYEAFGWEIVRPLNMFGVMHHSMIYRANKEAIL
ncbi:acyl-CoA N-acyltransferase [Trichoderma sp. SZMC 28014]